MGFLQWAEQKTQAMSIWDIGMLKWCCILAGMIAGAYGSAFVLQYSIWFILAAVGLCLILLIRVFSHKNNKDKCA